MAEDFITTYVTHKEYDPMKKSIVDSILQEKTTNQEQQAKIEENTGNIAVNTDKIRTNEIRIEDIEDKIDKIKDSQSNLDLSEYAKTSEVEQKISDEIAKLDYISEEAVDEKLESYVQTEKLQDYLTSREIGETYITREDADAKYMQKGQIGTGEDGKTIDLSEYAKKEDVSGFITESSVEEKLDAYATTETLAQDYVSKEEAKSFIDEETLESKEFVTKSQLETDGYVKLDYVQDNYITEADADSRYLKQGSDGSVDLTDYAKTEDIEKTYATKEEIGDFVTNGDLTEYAKTEDIGGFALKNDLDEYITSEEAEKTYLRISQYQMPNLDEYVQASTLDSYAEKTDLDDYVKKSETSEYVTETQLDNEINSVKDELTNSYLSKDEVNDYLKKTEADEKYATQVALTNYNLALEGKAGLDYVNSTFIKQGEAPSLPNMDNLVTSDTLDNYVLKEEIEDFVNNSDLNEKLNDYSKTEDVDNTLKSYAKKEDIPTFAAGSSNIEITQSGNTYTIKVKYI